MKSFIQKKESCSMEYNIRHKIIGCLFGQAVGDALGLGTEFMRKSEVEACYPNGLTDYEQILQDHHRRRWQRGDWTDDTDMMLCIARAIIETGKADIPSIARNFKAWLYGTPMGIGQNTFNVLSLGDYESNPFKAAEIVWELSRRRSAANGALMRTSVVGLLPNYTRKDAEDVCRLTHADSRCIGSCVIICDIIHALAYGGETPTLDELLALSGHYDSRIAEYVLKAYDGNLSDVCLDDEKMGYTLNTLFVALWAFWHTQSFEEGLLTIVNEGGDADTNAAVACSLLGAKFGFDAIPKRYVDGLVRKDTMTDIVNKLIEILGVG